MLNTNRKQSLLWRALTIVNSLIQVTQAFLPEMKKANTGVRHAIREQQS